jgi:predicted house-cleaning NTP pyrophosphatase (Maf/HAM1 superfamily)
MLKRYVFFPAIWITVLVLWALPALAETIVDTAWVRTYNGPGNSNDNATAIAIDGSGNVYVTGSSWDNATLEDYATIKYFPNGDTAWVRRYNGSGDNSDGASAVAVDGSGNVYVTGGSVGSGPGQDYATIKYYANGDTAWVRRYNGPGNDHDVSGAIVLDGYGNVYVTGGSVGSGPGQDFATIKYFQAPRGDANGDRMINIADVVYLINFLFIDGPAPVPIQAGDVNCNDYITAADVVYLINYLFIGGPPPCEP